MMVLGFLMVWTYDMVSRATSENDQLGQVWDRVVMRFLDHDLPSFGAKREASAPAKKIPVKAPAVRERAVVTATADVETTSVATRADMPALSPEEYARQTRLRRASSTRAEQEMRSRTALKRKNPNAEPNVRGSKTGRAEINSPRATAVKERVERTRRALNDIISRVTKSGN